MTREAYEKMTLRSDDWFIDAELILNCVNLNLRIYEIPVEFQSLGKRKSCKTRRNLGILQAHDRVSVRFTFANRKQRMIETIFVTGGSSTLGEHVRNRLMSHFHVLAVVHRHTVEIPDAEIELLHGGLEETVRNPRALQRAQVILHMAAVTHADDPAEYFRVNAELTKQLVSACNASQRFIYVSTICAHPDGGAYGRSKWLAEAAIRGSRLDYTIVRPSEIYGSRDGEGIDALVALARKVRILPDFRYGGSIKYAPISAQEAAHFIAEATIRRHHTGQTYTLCADRLCTAPDMARALRSCVRPLFVVPVPIIMLRVAKALRVPMPFKLDQLDRLVLSKTYDSALARRDYDFRPRSFLDHLAEREKITVGAGSGR